MVGVPRAVEGAQQPAAAREDDEARDRGVVYVDERERAAAGRLPAELADHAAVEHRGGDGARPDRVDDLPHAVADAPRERVHRLGARDDVPALLGEDAADQRGAAAGPAAAPPAPEPPAGDPA